ncbi:MAG: hypothetical protein ACTSX1_04065, partial [Candidatus Heimdallarchaeaceae archaeon]
MEVSVLRDDLLGSLEVSKQLFGVTKGGQAFLLLEITDDLFMKTVSSNVSAYSNIVFPIDVIKRDENEGSYKNAFSVDSMHSFLSRTKANKVTLVLGRTSLSIRAGNSHCSIPASNISSVVIENMAKFDESFLEKGRHLDRDEFSKAVNAASRFNGANSTSMPPYFNTVGMQQGTVYSSNRVVIFCCKIGIEDTYIVPFTVNKLLSYFQSSKLNIFQDDKAFHFFEKDGPRRKYMMVYNIASEFPFDSFCKYFDDFEKLIKEGNVVKFRVDVSRLQNSLSIASALTDS